LIVLLEAVEDVRLADEAIRDQRLHVHDRRRIAERQADFRLEILRFRHHVRAPDVAVVVAHRLLAEDVLPGVERRERQLLVILAAILPARDDVDDVDVDTAQEALVVGLHLGDAELLRACRRQFSVEIAQDHDVAQRRAHEARKVGRTRPSPGPDDPAAEAFGQSPTPVSSGRSTQRRSRWERSTALMISCTRALWAKLPWFASPPSVISFAKLWTRFA